VIVDRHELLVLHWEDKMSDEIKHPKHYTQGIECWDYIVSHDMSYLEGNIVKYVTRYKHKNGLQDLKKAKQYLDKLIEKVTKEQSDEHAL
jgi:hypothetical protein